MIKIRTSVYFTLVLVLITVIVSCKKKEEVVVDSIPPISPQLINEIKEEMYSDAEAPEGEPVFLWDFSKKNVYGYDFEQMTKNSMDMGEGGKLNSKPGEMDQTMSAKGDLFIKSQGDGTADLVLKDLKASMKMNMGNNQEPRTMEQAMPPFVAQGIKEDGTGPFGNSSQDLFLKMLFPLPTKTLRLGESIDIPAQMPFNAMGSMLMVKGRSKITLKRYVKIGKRTCAELNVDIDISDLNVPSDLEGEYKCSTKGTSVFYFDTESRCFISGYTAMVMQFSVDAPMPKMNISGEKESNMPKRTKMSMISDNLIKVKLKEK
ncbi:MAG: hypothetical protein KAI43_12810 [Candidatus Aureabacteria bacterium]|nr:hypothetical protein [Candidatus Auribacterota bacterium]